MELLSSKTIGLNKVGVYMVPAYLSFKLYMVTLIAKKGHHKDMCYNEIRPYGYRN